MGKSVAVVTGSNKGIGFAIVRGLCKQFKGDVLLTARDEDRGKKAVEDLNKEGLYPKFHQLDICDAESIAKCKEFLETEYGGLDVLVNNAGIAYKRNSTAPFSEQAETTMATNFTGTLNVCNAFFPLLRPHARVVNISSMQAKMYLQKCSEDLQKRLTDSNLSQEGLTQLVNEFVDSTKTNTHVERGWPSTAYGTSEIAITFMSFLVHREVSRDISRPDIVVNVCCPGKVQTDMSSHQGDKTTDHGADTPVYLAMLPPQTTSPKGNFVCERKIVDLTNFE